MKKAVKISVLVLAGVFVVYTFYFLWKQSQPKPVVYEILTAEKRDIVKQTVATGDIEARTQIELKPQVNGIIDELRVEAGDKIKAGEIIALVKVIPDMSQLNQAQGKVETSIVDLDEKEREFRRAEALFEKGVISREEYDQYKAKVDEARENLITAQSQIEVITKGASSRSGAVNTTQIISTMNGTVLSVPVKVGSSVSAISMYSAGTTVAKVGDMNDIIYKGNIDETEVAKLRIGMEIQLQPGSMQDVKIPAVLEYIAPEGELKDGTKMFEIRASAKAPEGITVRSGYSVNAFIILAQAEGALCVNETAVQFEGDETFVYKLTSADGLEKQTFEKVPVKLGISDGIYVQILEGVTEGMKIRGIQL